MASTFTTRLRLEKQGTGENDNTWGTLLNGTLDMVDDAIAGYVSISVAGSGNYTLTVNNAPTVDEARQMLLKFTGALTGNKTVTAPAVEKLYFVNNATTGAFTLTFKTSTSTGIVIPQGTKQIIYYDSDASDFVKALDTLTATTYIQSLLDDVDAAAARTTLGLGTVAVKNTGTSGDAVPLLNAANTWSGGQTITLATASGHLTLESTDDGTTVGPEIILFRNPAGSAAGDEIGIVRFRGKDSGSTTVQFGSFFSVIEVNTAGSRSGKFGWNTPQAGTESPRFWLGGGFYSHTATGGDKGIGSGNFSSVWDDGVQINPEGTAKAWATWVVSTATLSDSFNVTSLTDNGTGDTTVNFTTAFATANYSAIATGESTSGAPGGVAVTNVKNAGKTASSCRLFCNSNGSATDLPTASAIFLGDQ